MTVRVSGDARRAWIVNFVAEYWRQHRLAPTLQEITEGCGLASRSSTAYQVGVLIAEGRLERVARSPRSLRVVERQ